MVRVNDRRGALMQYRNTHPIAVEVLGAVKHIFGCAPVQVYVQLPSDFDYMRSRFVEMTNDARAHFGLDLFTGFETPEDKPFADPGLNEELH